jgi:hypothetical protein
MGEAGRLNIMDVRQWGLYSGGRHRSRLFLGGVIPGKIQADESFFKTAAEN